MTGRELRQQRYDLDASIDDVARRVDLSADTLAQWESLDLRIPRHHAGVVRMALWAIRVDQVMEASGLPACEWMSRFDAADDVPDTRAVRAHGESCEVCRAREAYSRKHGPRMPGAMGWWDVAFGCMDVLPAPLASAARGALLALAFTALPAVALFVVSLLQRDTGGMLEAAAMLAVALTAGAAGGLGYHLSAGLRARGTPGYYASWILTAYGALAGMVGAFTGIRNVPRMEVPPLLDLVRDPFGLALVLAIGAVFGVTVGRSVRHAEYDDARDDVPADTPIDVSRRARWVGIAGTVLALTATGLHWWSGRLERENIGSPAPTAAESTKRLPSLERVVREHPDDPAAQYNLGMALAALDRHEDALLPLQRAVELVPRNPSFQNAYGWSLLQLRRYDEAVPPLQRAVERNSDYRRAHRNLGNALAHLGRLEEATMAFTRVVALDSTDDTGHELLARALVEQYRFEEAWSEAELAVRLDSTYALNRETAARALLGLGRMEEALHMYREATRLAPDGWWYWRELGRMAHLMKRYDEADDAFARVDALEPGYFAREPEDRALWNEARRARRNNIALPRVEP